MREIEGGVFVSGQIAPTDVARLAEAGIATLINNRPDGEERGQPTSAEIASAARAAGVAYVHLPVAGAIAPEAVSEMRVALAGQRSVLAFCRSGMRSAALWACARAAEGREPDDLIAAGRSAGVELEGLRAMLAAQRLPPHGSQRRA